MSNQAHAMHGPPRRWSDARAPNGERVSRAARLPPNRHAVASGALLAAAGVPITIAHGVHGVLLPASVWLTAFVLIVVAVCVVAAIVIVQHPRAGRTLAAAAAIGTVSLGVPVLSQEPMLTLAVFVGMTVGIAVLWEIGEGTRTTTPARQRLRRAIYERQTLGAALMALGLWVVTGLLGNERIGVEFAAVVIAFAVTFGLAVEWMIRERRRATARVVVLLATSMAAALTLVAQWGRWHWVEGAGGAFAVMTVLLTHRPRHDEMEQTSWWEPLLGHPERLFVGTFASLSAIGTVLLALPHSSASGRSVGLIDAAFTAVSAVCVTGLVVRDTPVEFSLFGQTVILTLLQIGGLGIMTFSTAAVVVLRRRLSLRHEGAVASLISTQDRGRLFATAQRILGLTFVTELAGATLLYICFFMRGDPPAAAAWRAVFTSISAFCNAGFALQSDSLIAYQQTPVVLHVVATLIVLGGLSPLVVFALPSLLRRRHRPVSAQIGLGLAMTGVLLIGGFGFLLASEWGNTLAHLAPLDRIHNAWFQSVTLRTAGFNSIEPAAARPATLTMMLLWMFIGGNPGGTAGGVKTTTVAVLALGVIDAIRGRWAPVAFGARLSERTRAKAAVTVTLAATMALVACMTLELTQRIDAPAIVFEVISALGTVGLSIGATTQLDGIGKGVILVCMFVGRVGGLTLLLFLSGRRPIRSIGRPEQEIDVG